MEPPEIFQSILVADDGSAEAQHAVVTAFSLAKCYNAKIVLLWVKTPPPAEEQAEGYGLEEYQRAQTQREQLLQQSAQDGRQQGLQVPVTEIDSNAVAGEIEKYVEEHAVDLLVVGRRHISGLRHLL